jgi:anti-sigma B factor antagonist
MEGHGRATGANSVGSTAPDSAGPTATGSRIAARTRRQLLRIERGSAGEVVLVGEIDMSNVAELREALERAAAQGPSMVIDLSAVTYLDSAGVSALFDQAYRDLRVRVAADSAVATVIKICGLIHVARVEFVPAVESVAVAG